MELREYFQKYPRAAIAFSGGVDSAYLLWAARQYGAEVKAYYVKSAFQPVFELEDARKLAKELGAEMEVLPLEVLDCEAVAANPMDRCYYCKQQIFGKIRAAAERDGYGLVLDGTNASDEAGDRPGMKALDEMKVGSPLRECGLTKAMIRELSREAGLFTWDKPAYACLATRIPAGEKITEEKLKRIELAEEALRELGFSDLRIRKRGEAALIQLPETQLARAVECRQEIVRAVSPYFQEITMDLRGRS